MFESKRPTLRLSFFAVLLVAVILSACRGGGSGISPTYTIPIPPTPTTISGLDSPKAVVNAFFSVYGGSSAGMVQITPLFSSAYTAKPAVLACAFQNIRDTYGPPVSQDIGEPQVSGDTATLAVSFVSPGRTGKMTFATKKEGTGWKIDSIIGWIGGDITPKNPVGETQSCLNQ